MNLQKRFTDEDINGVWQIINDDLSAATSTLDYQATITIDKRDVYIDISSSAGGSLEGGYEKTVIDAPLYTRDHLRFSIHPQDFVNQIGKIFGMEDIVLGYPAFDDATIVKTNDAELVKKAFAAEWVRNAFQSLSGYTLKIEEGDKKEENHLELVIQRAITNTAELTNLFNAFVHVLTTLDAPEVSHPGATENNTVYA